MEEIKRFSPGVARKIDTYVYRLIDPRDGKTFYVGKGKGDRVFAHARGVSGYDGEKFGRNEKMETIHDIIRSGKEVEYSIHRHGMSEETALEVEAALIDAYRDLTNQVRGHDVERGDQSVEQIESRYAKDPIDFHSGHKFLLIKTKWETVYSIEHGGSIEDAVRRSWIVNLVRARKVNYVLGIIDNVCVGVYSPEDAWHLAPGEENKPKGPRRSQFPMGHRVRDSEILSRYVNRVVPEDVFTRKAQGPLKYYDTK